MTTGNVIEALSWQLGTRLMVKTQLASKVTTGDDRSTTD